MHPILTQLHPILSHLIALLLGAILATLCIYAFRPRGPSLHISDESDSKEAVRVFDRGTLIETFPAFDGGKLQTLLDYLHITYTYKEESPGRARRRPGKSATTPHKKTRTRSNFRSK
jgi:hypothetical protein